MENPYIRTLIQGGSVANQGMANASKMLDSVENIFNASGSLALKMNMLLEQEEARKQQELLQMAQFMHQVQQDEFMNKYRQEDLKFRKENAEALNKYRYDDLRFRQESFEKKYALDIDKTRLLHEELEFNKEKYQKEYELKKADLLLKNWQNKINATTKLYKNYYSLKEKMNNAVAKLSSIDKELASENLTIEQRNALLQQKQAIQNNISLYGEQMQNIVSQINPTMQNETPSLTLQEPTATTTQPVGSNTSNRVTPLPSVFNNQNNMPEIKTYKNSIYVTEGQKQITIVNNNGKIIDGNVKNILKDMPEPTQQKFLLNLYKNLSDNINFDTGGIANVLPRVQNMVNSLAKHIKDDKARKTFIATAYIDIADKIGNYPGISDIDKYKFGLKIANQFNNPKVLNEVSKRLWLPVKSTYTLLNYKNEDIYHIYKMLNDQGTISSLAEIGLHRLGLNDYDIDGTPVTKEKMKIGLYQTLKELAKDGYNDYNIALALKELKSFSHNKFFDTVIKAVQLYGYKNKGTLAETVTDKIDLSKYEPKIHLSKNQQRANAIKERLALGGFKRTELYKQNINTDPAINKIKQIFSTENIDLDGDYELPILVYGEPVTIKAKGEDIVNAYLSDIFLPKFKDIIKDSRLEPIDILNRKNMNAINKWTNE